MFDDESFLDTIKSIDNFNFCFVIFHVFFYLNFEHFLFDRDVNFVYKLNEHILDFFSK